METTNVYPFLPGIQQPVYPDAYHIKPQLPFTNYQYNVPAYTVCYTKVEDVFFKLLFSDRDKACSIEDIYAEAEKIAKLFSDS
jgi:hypothetical protein